MHSNIHPDVIHFVSKSCSSEWSHYDRVNNYYLQFITEGSVMYEIDGYAFTANKGDVVFIKPGSDRKATTSGMSCIVIAFLLPPQEDIDLPLCFFLGSFEEFHFFFQDLKFEWLQRNPGFILKSQATLMLILHKLIYERGQGRKNQYVELMKQYIMKHYSEKLTVKKIAEKVGLNPVYCGALFKKYENATVLEFAARIRINKAISLLETDEYTVTEIAEAIGFKDVYSFSNTFKKVVGVAPGIYKKTLSIRVSE